MGERLTEKWRASARPFMLILLLTLMFCMAQNLVPAASAWLVGMETNAAILALSIFTVILFRVRSAAPPESLRATSQIEIPVAENCSFRED
jgi:hypothetical protein